MKKSIIPILLCVIMLFCACKPTVEYTVSPNAVKYKYHTFKGTDWGMTKEECMTALGVDEKDIEPLNEEYKEYYPDCDGFSIKRNVYGNPATAYFIFTLKIADFEYDFGLTGVEIEYDSGCDNQAIYDNLCKDARVKKPSKYEAFDINHLNEKYESESSFEELEDKELLRKAEGFFADMQKNWKAKRDFMDQPFTRIDIDSAPNKGVRIVFIGSFAAILHKLL